MGVFLAISSIDRESTFLALGTSKIFWILDKSIRSGRPKMWGRRSKGWSPRNSYIVGTPTVWNRQNGDPTLHIWPPFQNIKHTSSSIPKDAWCTLSLETTSAFAGVFSPTDLPAPYSIATRSRRRKTPAKAEDFLDQVRRGCKIPAVQAWQQTQY